MRKLGRLTKAEILEAEARFLEGQSIYKIGRAMRRKQRPIKLHLINLGLLEEICLEINYTQNKDFDFRRVIIKPNFYDVMILGSLFSFYPFLSFFVPFFFIYLLAKSIDGI